MISWDYFNAFFESYIATDQFYTSAVIFGATFSVLYILKFVLLNRITAFAEKSKTDIDDFFVDAINIWDLWSIITLSTLLFLVSYDYDSEIVSLIVSGLVILISTYVVRTIQRIVTYSISKILFKKGKSDQIVLNAINTSTQIILYSVILIFVLQNLGVDVSALITGLGIGGIAIAFALQNILGDIFSAFSIYIDKPYGPGDVINVGGDVGEVKHIGLRTTRVKTLDGEELIIGNKELSEIRVRNYNKMRKRRVVFSLGVTYETDQKKLAKIPAIIEEIVTKEEKAEFSRTHFKEFGDFSLNYEIVFNITTRDYDVYMDTLQNINLAIVAAFEKNKIEFAYPTQVQYNK